ncbi:MAG: hypothetical protein E7509_00120 [Ruminococcus sp.]|nr:hypothetical protein [Ruminococcus sp.]
MAESIFDIPGFTFFAEKNNFSGSALKTFNYKIWYGEQFTVKVWYGVNCYSCTDESEIVAEMTAEFIPESLKEIKVWLEGQLEIFKNKN